MSKGLKKSSKKKQKLYLKFLKTKTLEDEPTKVQNVQKSIRKTKKKS